MKKRMRREKREGKKEIRKEDDKRAMMEIRKKPEERWAKNDHGESVDKNEAPTFITIACLV